MSQKLSPALRLANARRAVQLAENECPHWDPVFGTTVYHECCYHLDDAIREYKKAKRAARGTTQ